MRTSTVQGCEYVSRPLQWLKHAVATCQSPACSFIEIISSPKATAHYHYLSLICSASSDQRNTPVWQQCSPLEDRHDVAVCPTLRPLSCSLSQTHGATACHFPRKTQLCSLQAKTNDLRSSARPEMVQNACGEDVGVGGCSQRALSIVRTQWFEMNSHFQLPIAHLHTPLSPPQV